MGTKENFEKKFIKGEGCWLWNAAKTSQGYGQFGYKGMMQGAHRVAFELYVGEIPEHMQVLHMCDTPGCVNPTHLYLGTNADNVKERTAKGRTAKRLGEDHPQAAFTEDTVQKLRDMYATGLYTHRGLAFKFGVSKTTVSYALKGLTYAAGRKNV